MFAQAAQSLLYTPQRAACLPTDIEVDDSLLEVVKEFCYLVDTLAAGGDCTSAIINLCKAAVGKFRPLLLIPRTDNSLSHSMAMFIASVFIP